MTAAEMIAVLSRVPGDTPVLHRNGYDVCHIDVVHRVGSLSKPGTLRVELEGRVCREAPAPAAQLVGRWPAASVGPVDADTVRDALLDIVRDSIV